MLLRKQSVRLLNPSSEAELLSRISQAGHVCYQTDSIESLGQQQEFYKRLVRRGHESVLEHVSISADITTDRGMTHELVRHRIAAYSQESTRYCNYGGKPIQVIYQEGFKNLNQIDLEFIDDVLNDIEGLYTYLLDRGVAPQWARAILPTCLKTEIVVTYNLRQWRHVLKQRLAPEAHPMMQELMQLILKQFLTIYPTLFWDFEQPVPEPAQSAITTSEMESIYGYYKQLEAECERANTLRGVIVDLRPAEKSSDCEDPTRAEKALEAQDIIREAEQSRKAYEKTDEPDEFV